MQLALTAPRPRLLLALALLAAVAACSSEGGHDPIGPTVTLARVDVTPATPWLAAGSTMRFYATAVYSDGTNDDVTEQATWTSSQTSILMVSSVPGFCGQANAVTAGSSIVTAQFQGVAGSTTVTVLPSMPTVVRVDLWPPAPWLVVGTTMGFRAIAVYADQRTADVTEQATWESSAGSLLSVSNAAGTRGEAAALGTGSSTVQATYDGVSGSAEATVLAAGSGVKLAGTVTYDFVPATYDPTSRSGTLSFVTATRRPVRGALVQVMQGSVELDSAVTDAQGRYEVEFAAGGTVNVRALAETSSPPIRVVDNMDGGAGWAIGRSVPASNATVNLHATHGWTGTTYDPIARTAAPFAILDSMYTAATGFVNAGRDPAYPPLRVNWSPDNSTSTIGTSYYSPSEGEIYILGKVGEDTDEFDDHVVVHEWAHYFEDQLSRSDSIGGPHGPGDVLDPRLAFGEGYGTAIASILLANPIYADTMWYGSLTAFGFSAETVPSPTDDCDYNGSSCVPGLNPGPFSEMSIIRALYDLHDAGTNEAWDTTSIPLGTLYDVLVGPETTTPAFTTIASFITGLKAQAGVDGAAVDAVLAHHGIGAISDDWGTGDADLRAMYRDVSVPSGPQAFTLDGRYDPNTQQQNRYLAFTGTGSDVTVTSACAYDVDLYGYRQGTLLAWDESIDGYETIRFATEPDEVYVVVLNGWGAVYGTYSATVTVSTP